MADDTTTTLEAVSDAIANSPVAVQTSAPLSFSDAVINFTQTIIDWFSNFFQNFIDSFTDLHVMIVNWLIRLAAACVNFATDLVPDFGIAISDLGSADSIPAQVICFINWFVPLDVMTECLGIYFVFLSFYLGGGSVLRFFKVLPK